MTAFLRGPTIWVTELGWVRRLITEHSMGRRFAERFVAGDTVETSMEAAQTLAGHGIASILDHLGENVSSVEQASQATEAYIAALERIHETPGLDCCVSVKLTQLGLDGSMDLARENMERVLKAAEGPSGPVLVMIDMEASIYVDRTLSLYLSLRESFPSVGVCLQSYLFRTEGDAARIGGPQAIVRVCKGAYLEPAEVAYRAKDDVNRSFAHVGASLLASRSVVHFATHDPQLIRRAQEYIHGHGLPREQYEFQMLFGIRRDLQTKLAGEGEPVRVYIPYGTHWYPYLTRRMAERPANMWFFVSNALR